VVGAGATQVIFAAIYAANKLHGTNRAYINRPYWFRFPKMCGMANLDFATHRFGALTESTMEILTIPNNPDNTICDPAGAHLTLVDACYNWPQYLESLVKIDAEIVVFSLAKATGHAGTRIGWAVVKNNDMANAMLEYIEYSTGGISVDAQSRANTLLHGQLSIRGKTTCFDSGKSVLAFRWRKLLEALPNGYEALNREGMFLWGKLDGVGEYGPEADAAKRLEDDYGIVCMGGRKCGGTDSNFRINVGCDERSFQAMIQRFKGSRE
jgi:L-tryptophan--pyruvate aminotransferase